MSRTTTWDIRVQVSRGRWRVIRGFARREDARHYQRRNLYQYSIVRIVKSPQKWLLRPTAPAGAAAENSLTA